MNHRTGEHLIAVDASDQSQQFVIKVRTVRRVPPEDRWEADAVSRLQSPHANRTSGLERRELEQKHKIERMSQRLKRKN